MEQNLFNLLLTVVSTLLGIVLKVVWDAIKDLQSSDKELADKVNKIETLVAGNYITRMEFDRVISRVFDKLDSIDTKLNNHVSFQDK